MDRLEDLQQEHERVLRQLEEAEDTIRALRSGEADAVLVETTDREHQVFTLDRADHRYRMLVEHMPQGAATLTSAGRILYCNPRFLELLGRPLDGVIGHSIGELVSPASRPIVDALLRVGQESSANADVALVRADGAMLPVHLGAGPLHDGPLGLCLIVTDLTEQRHFRELQRTQEALRASEARLASELASARKLQQVSSRLVRGGDTGELYDAILAAAMDIMSSDMASLQEVDEDGESLRLLAIRGFDESFRSTFARVTSHDGSVCSAAFRARRRIVVRDVQAPVSPVHGAVVQALERARVRAVQSTPLVSRDGGVLGMLSTHWRAPHDPTEEELQLLDVLARQGADLIERNRAEQALRDADRRKDEFLATLAHELRNPLAPIRNAMEILKVDELGGDELDWTRGVLDRQVRLMARLLDDLLDVSRISRNVLDVKRERVELRKILDVALETSRPLIDSFGHDLHVDLPAEPVYLDADPVRLGQVFANLLNNAAKYTEPEGKIRVSAQRRDREVAVTVQDNGIGIAPEMMPTVFEMFSQGKPALSRTHGGLGVGLSLARALVELHKGSLEGNSDGLGRGSEFVVRLPVIDEPLARGRKPVRADATSVAKRRILIVDDNRDSADSLARLLSLRGQEVRTAYDGEHAIAAVQEFRPEVALLDIGMPVLNGYEACRRIRELPEGRNVFLIALTGWGQEEDRRRTEEAGFDLHMVKPVAAQALMSVLASARR